MTITDALLTFNPYSRPGAMLRGVRAVVMHWTANPAVSARANRDFFEHRKNGQNGYGSAHYIVGLKGEVLRCVPAVEVAYHCGSGAKDPASGRVYTDLARAKFGDYAAKPNLSPNLVTLGVEMCPTTDKGDFAGETLVAAEELVADLLRRFNLTTDDIVTHHDVVGWKDCPRLWVRRPEAFKAFKEQVERLLTCQGPRVRSVSRGNDGVGDAIKGGA